MLSRLDQARSSSYTSPGRELKEEWGGQAESSSSGELSLVSWAGHLEGGDGQSEVGPVHHLPAA